MKKFALMYMMGFVNSAPSDRILEEVVVMTMKGSDLRVEYANKDVESLVDVDFGLQQDRKRLQIVMVDLMVEVESLSVVPKV